MPYNNKTLAKIFYEIAELLEAQGVRWKPRAYRKAAQTLETMQKDIAEIAKLGEKELVKLPGIGRNIAKKIIEFLQTGKVKKLEELRKEFPFDIAGFTSIEGIGPRTALLIYEKLGIKTVDELIKAAREHRLARIKGIGPKTEQAIMQLEQKAHKQRFLLPFALEIAEELCNYLRGIPEVEECYIAGSLRRYKETIGDIDLLAVAEINNWQTVCEKFCSYPNVDHVLGCGKTRASVVLREGIQADLRVVGKENTGSALQYLTGSKQHSIALRVIAKEKNLKLNEYGVFKDGNKIAGKTEQEVYSTLGLDYIEPELRENRGEIEAAKKHSLPKLVEWDSVKADLQMHTTYSDGANTIEEMAIAAIKLGRELIAITDHSSGLAVAHGMNENKIRKQWKEIDSLNKKFQREGINFRILKGIEANIDKDGKLDVPNSLLKDFDLVIAAIHYGFKGSKVIQTARYLEAISNEYVNIIAHPSGRKLLEKEPMQIDWPKIFEACKANNVMLEINAFPNRLDLDSFLVKEAIESGVILSIGTDSHSVEHLQFLRYGVAVARRGWCESKHIINSWPTKEIMKALDKG
ncbi:MAG: DNA polymerase/3'-5' exonuclease PolX [Candidatus Diapherotrites archaeon]|nr:DNA polymerase/3'-5' exonuclease PolX [Candidatus Diapherotrites archaeon]